MGNDINYKPDKAIPPGATILDNLNYLGMTQRELAIRMGRPFTKINRIIKGKKNITLETAFQLERVLSIPAKVWMNLEQNYQETVLRLKEKKLLTKEKKILHYFPHKELMKKEWIASTDDQIEIIKSLLSFFGVQSLKYIKKIDSVAFRITNNRKINEYAIASWLRQGEITAQKINTQPFQKQKVLLNIQKIKKLTSNRFENFKEKLTDLCSQCGIALAIVPHLEKTFVQGASRWLSPNKAIIQLSLRYKYSDIFWFSFFHELGHILLHGKKQAFIKLDIKNKKKKKKFKQMNLQQIY